MWLGSRKNLYKGSELCSWGLGSGVWGLAGLRESVEPEVWMDSRPEVRSEPVELMNRKSTGLRQSIEPIWTIWIMNKLNVDKLSLNVGRFNVDKLNADKLAQCIDWSVRTPGKYQTGSLPGSGKKNLRKQSNLDSRTMDDGRWTIWTPGIKTFAGKASWSPESGVWDQGQVSQRSVKKIELRKSLRKICF